MPNRYFSRIRNSKLECELAFLAWRDRTGKLQNEARRISSKSNPRGEPGFAREIRPFPKPTPRQQCILTDQQNIGAKSSHVLYSVSRRPSFSFVAANKVLVRYFSTWLAPSRCGGAILEDRPQCRFKRRILHLQKLHLRKFIIRFSPFSGIDIVMRSR